jgi:hypothetical protein
MVETKKGHHHGPFDEMLHHRGLVQIILLPHLNAFDLFKFARLNKRSMQLLDPKSEHCVNYKVLYKAQKHELSHKEELETHESLAKAL